jgi:hypothetical protein
VDGLGILSLTEAIEGISSFENKSPQEYSLPTCDGFIALLQLVTDYCTTIERDESVLYPFR